MTDQKTQNHAFARSRSNVGLEVMKPNAFCLACLGTGGRWYARFTGLRLPEWKKCKVCMTANVELRGAHK